MSFSEEAMWSALNREVFSMLEPSHLTYRQGYMSVENLIDLMGTGWLLTDLRLAPLHEDPLVIATLEQGPDQIMVMVLDNGSIRDALQSII